MFAAINGQYRRVSLLLLMGQVENFTADIFLPSLVFECRWAALLVRIAGETEDMSLLTRVFDAIRALATELASPGSTSSQLADTALTFLYR